MARRLTQKELAGETFTPFSGVKLTFWQRLGQIWDEFKWLIIFTLCVLAAIIYALNSCFGNHAPDLTLCLVSDERVFTDEECERVKKELVEFVLDVNGDGAGSLQVLPCYSGDDYENDPNKLLAHLNYEQQILGGYRFLMIADPESVAELAAKDLLEPMTVYSEQLSEDYPGPLVGDCLLFDEDTDLYKLFDGYRIVTRAYSADGKGESASAKREIRSLKIFFESVLLDWQPTEELETK